MKVNSSKFERTTFIWAACRTLQSSVIADSDIGVAPMSLHNPYIGIKNYVSRYLKKYKKRSFAVFSRISMLPVKIFLHLRVHLKQNFTYIFNILINMGKLTKEKLNFLKESNVFQCVFLFRR